MGKGTTSKRGKDGRKPARPRDREPAAAEAANPKEKPKDSKRVVRDEAADESPAVQFKPPLEPRRGLFVAMVAVFALWIGFLLFMYFKTEYGHSLEQHAAPRPTPPGAESTR